MFFEEIKNIRSEDKELRKFGITMSITFSLLGFLFLWRGRSFYIYFLILSPFFLAFGLIVPNMLKPIQKLWMSMAIIIRWFMTRLIIFVVFYLVIFPISIIARIFGKVFLDKKFDRSISTYWVSKEAHKYEKENYENQF